MIRDLVREIQSARKKADFNIADRIETQIEFDDKDLSAALDEWEDYVMKETLSKELQIGKLKDAKIKFDFESEAEVHGVEVKIGLKKGK